MAEHKHLNPGNPKKPEKSFEEYFEEEVFMTRAWGPEVEKRLQEGKKIAQKKLKEDGIEIDLEELYTANELEEYYNEGCIAQGVPEKLLYYMNYAQMARDDNYSGYLNYIDVKPPEAVHTIRYFYFTR